VAQVPTFHLPPPEIAHSISGAIFMQGPGGLLAVPLAQRYGRLPVLFWSQFLTLLFTIGATFCTDYASFTACRTLQGFFGAPPQVIGLSIIHDMFYFHERARKVNIWACSFLIGPYLGPFISGFLIQKLTWVDTFGVLAGFYGLSVLMIIFLGDETLFNRHTALSNGQHAAAKQTGFGRRIMLLLGVAGVKESSSRPGLLEVSKDLFSVFVRPYVFLPSKCLHM